MIQAANGKDEKGKEEEAGKKRSAKQLAEVVGAIWKSEGGLGFFKGLQAQILKTVLSSALLLMIKEKIARTTWIFMLAVRRFFLLYSGSSRPKLKPRPSAG